MTDVLSFTAPPLVNERGGPVPPADILSRLSRVDPALGLRWTANFAESQWALTWEWKESDPRWERVRCEEISRESAYDIIGYLPVGCSVDQAASYVESHLKNYPKEEISKLREKVRNWNTVEQPKNLTDSIIGDIMDDVARDKRAPVGRTFFGRKFGK